MTTYAAQPGILADVPRAGRYLFFFGHWSVGGPVAHGAGARCTACGWRLRVWGWAHKPWPRWAALYRACALPVVVGYDRHAAQHADGFVVLASGRDPGDLVLMGQALQHALAPAWRLDSVVDGFGMGRGPTDMGGI